MDVKNILVIINDLGVVNIFFKIIIVVFAILYYLYALIITKQVKTMDKTLKDKYNWIIIFITSLQVTVSLVLLLLLVLVIFFI